jgi:hypothetical protein
MVGKPELNPKSAKVVLVQPLEIVTFHVTLVSV